MIGGDADHPALAWRRAGLMAVTGAPEGPPRVCPAAVAAAADGALLALKALAPEADALPACGAMLLGERARLMGLARGGRISANGSCRLLDCIDGRVALNLARPEDWDLLPILLDAESVPDWPAVERAMALRPVEAAMALGIELGLPIARDLPAAGRSLPFELEAVAPRAPRAGRPLVLDFAPLWAGPLAASLLGLLGARVVKIESISRPDGARRGHPDFYALLNGGKRSVAVDFDDPAARAALARLVDAADVVIEGSRPRALRRLGIDRAAAVARGRVWISITAHADPDRVGFGDDAAVEGGLADTMLRGWGAPMFAGDAIGDPLTGVHAALAAWALWSSRRAGLVRLSLAGTVAAALRLDSAAGEALADWQSLALADPAPLYPLRPAGGAIRALGADNALLG